MWHMITVVEDRWTVTRLCFRWEHSAQTALTALVAEKTKRDWLAVSKQLVTTLPMRSAAECDRVDELYKFLHLEGELRGPR